MTTFFQCFILVFITFYSGYGIIRIFNTVFKPGSKNIRFNLALIYLIGFIPLAFVYSILGGIGHLDRESFSIIMFLIGLPSLFSIKSELLTFKNRLRWPGKFELVVIISLLPILIYGISISLMPTANWDVISYVLSIPKTHVLEGNVRYLDEYGIFSAFPLYGESLVGVPYLLFGNENITQLYIFTFLINLFYLSQQVFRHFSRSTLYSILSLITIGYLPIILINLGIAKVEIPQAAFVLASILLLLKSNEWGMRFKMLSAILFTFAVGVKYTTIFYFPIYSLVYWGIFRKQKLNQVVVDSAIFFLIGVAVNSIWLVINFREHCNPLFPNLIHYFGSCKYSPEAISQIMTMVSESTLLQKGTSWQSTHSIFAYWPFISSALGVINCTLLALVFVIQIFSKTIRKKYPILISAQLGIIVIFLFQIFIYYWEFRYFCFVLVLISIVIFLIFDGLNLSKISKVILIVLVFIQSILSFMEFYRQNPYVALSIGSQLTDEEYKNKWIHLYWVAHFLNENTIPSDVIAFNWGVQPFYYLNRKYFFIHDWNPEGATQEMLAPSQLLDLLQRKKCNYLVWRNQDEARFQDPSISKQYHARMNGFVQELVKSGSLITIITKDDVIIYKIIEN